MHGSPQRVGKIPPPFAKVMSPNRDVPPFLAWQISSGSTRTSGGVVP